MIHGQKPLFTSVFTRKKEECFNLNSPEFYPSTLQKNQNNAPKGHCGGLSLTNLFFEAAKKHHYAEELPYEEKILLALHQVFVKLTLNFVVNHANPDLKMYYNDIFESIKNNNFKHDFKRFKDEIILIKEKISKYNKTNNLHDIDHFLSIVEICQQLLNSTFHLSNIGFLDCMDSETNLHDFKLFVEKQVLIPNAEGYKCFSMTTINHAFNLFVKYKQNGLITISFFEPNDARLFFKLYVNTSDDNAIQKTAQALINGISSTKYFLIGDPNVKDILFYQFTLNDFVEDKITNFEFFNMEKTHQLERAFCFFAQTNNLAGIEKILEKTPDFNINTENIVGTPPVFWAILCNNLKIVDFLIEHGANIHAKISQTTYPFPLTVEAISHTPLQYACHLGRIEIFEFLIEKFENTNIIFENGSTPMHTAAENGNIELIKRLLNHDFGINSRLQNLKENISNYNGATPLHMSIIAGQVDCVIFLLANGADLNALMEDGSSALHLAVNSGNQEIVDILLASGAKTHFKNNKGQTPLLLAVKDGIKGIVQTLLDHNSDINAQDNSGNTPMHIAAIGFYPNRNEVLKMLLKKEPNLSLINQKNFSVLTTFVYCNSFSKYGVPDENDLLLLLKNGCDTNQKNDEGFTALMYAVCNHLSSERCIELLLEYNAEINAKNHAGFTALHLACSLGYKKQVQFLLKNNADSTLKTAWGKTPIELTSDEEIKKLFLNLDSVN